MILSEQTINVLQNFATINQSLLFEPGNTLKTVSPQKTILAEVTVKETFPQEFAIYDLSQFLSALSLFTSAELEFFDTHLTISELERNVVSYNYADKSMFIVPPKKSLSLPDSDVKFTLSEKDLKKILQGARILNLQEIIIKNEGENIVVVAGDSKNSSMNSYKILIGKLDEDVEFNHVFKVDNLRIMTLNYNVEISKKGLASFKTADDLVKYFVTTETKK